MFLLCAFLPVLVEFITDDEPSDSLTVNQHYVINDGYNRWKLFTNIPQLKTEKNWPMWKFHALKGCWTVEIRWRNSCRWFFSQATESLLLHSTTYRSKKRASCDKLPDSKGTLGCAVQHIRKTVSNKVFSLMQLYGLRMKCGAKLQDHLQQLDEHSDQLTAIGPGEEVTELHKVAVLLQESYPTLVCT